MYTDIAFLYLSLIKFCSSVLRFHPAKCVHTLQYLYTVYVYTCTCSGDASSILSLSLSLSLSPLQQVLQLKHQNEALENEIDLLKKQVTYRDEFIEVGVGMRNIPLRILCTSTYTCTFCVCVFACIGSIA